jgi:hypothetical protein
VIRDREGSSRASTVYFVEFGRIWARPQSEMRQFVMLTESTTFGDASSGEGNSSSGFTALWSPRRKIETQGGKRKLLGAKRIVSHMH